MPVVCLDDIIILDTNWVFYGFINLDHDDLIFTNDDVGGTKCLIKLISSINDNEYDISKYCTEYVTTPKVLFYKRIYREDICKLSELVCHEFYTEYNIDEYGAGLLISEYIDGETLTADIVTKDNNLLRICEIIETLHNIGIVHGDIHDGNLMVDKFGKIYIIDFGNSFSSEFIVDDTVKWLPKNIFSQQDYYMYEETFCKNKDWMDLYLMMLYLFNMKYSLINNIRLPENINAELMIEIIYKDFPLPKNV